MNRWGITFNNQRQPYLSAEGGFVLVDEHGALKIFDHEDGNLTAVFAAGVWISCVLEASNA